MRNELTSVLFVKISAVNVNIACYLLEGYLLFFGKMEVVLNHFCLLVAAFPPKIEQSFLSPYVLLIYIVFEFLGSVHLFRS